MPGKTPSLIVFIDQKIFFKSDDKWLYPLFALEDFLVNHPANMAQAMIHDKVVGKAAAMLMARLNSGWVHGNLMSELAINFLERVGIPYSFDQRVARIQCKTEAILLDVDDIDEAYQILCKRAKRC